MGDPGWDRERSSLSEFLAASRPYDCGARWARRPLRPGRALRPSDASGTSRAWNTRGTILTSGARCAVKTVRSGRALWPGRTRSALRTCGAGCQSKGVGIKRYAAVHEHTAIRGIYHIHIAGSPGRKIIRGNSAGGLRAQHKIQLPEKADLHTWIGLGKDQIAAGVGIPNFDSNALRAAERQVREHQIERNLARSWRWGRRRGRDRLRADAERNHQKHCE